MIIIPHVVIEGNIETKNIFSELEPLFIKEEGTIIRSTNSFISSDGSLILVETIVIESGSKNQFFAIINQRDDGIVVRIYPGTDVEKTNGVKRSLAEIGKQILSKFQGTKIGKTNLEDFL